jgi:hypothetical protein
MKESHGGDKNNDFALTAHLIRARLHLLDGSYNFNGIHFKNLSSDRPCTKSVIFGERIKLNVIVLPDKHEGTKNIKICYDLEKHRITAVKCQSE